MSHRFTRYAYDWPERWRPFFWDCVAVPESLRPLTGDGAPEAYLRIARLVRDCIIKDEAQGIIAEVGVRAGGGLYTMALALDEAARGRTFQGIDPYEASPNYSQDYRRPDLREKTERALRAIIEDVYGGVYQFFQTTSETYAAQIADPDWTFAAVHLDGVHETEAVADEVRFFAPRVSPGGIVMVDNCEAIEHPKIDALCAELGLELWDVLTWRDVNFHHNNGHRHLTPLRKAYRRPK